MIFYSFSYDVKKHKTLTMGCSGQGEEIEGHCWSGSEGQGTQRQTGSQFPLVTDMHAEKGMS